MNDKRREPRKKLMAFTPVYDLLHRALIGYVGDLTPQGVMVIGQQTLDVNKHFTLGIEFPNEESSDHVSKIVVSARTAWCRVDDSPQYFNIGFQFLDVSTETARTIQAILDRYQFRNVMDISDLNL